MTTTTMNEFASLTREFDAQRTANRARRAKADKSAHQRAVTAATASRVLKVVGAAVVVGLVVTLFVAL